MSNMGDSVRNKNNAEDFLEFVSFNEAIHLQEVTTLLGSFVENGFLKKLFDKGPQAMDKAQLLVEMFGECANPNNFTEQAKATNIQPTTLSLLFTIAVYVSSSSSNTKTIPNPVLETPPILPDVEMTPVDQSVTPEISQKKDKQKEHVMNDKQVKIQSKTANPDAQTSARLKPQNDDQREQVRDIIVYDIPYTWDVEKILGELTLWGHTIKLSVKRQHKYQTLRVKIVLNSFTLPQFNKFWMTDLGGIPTSKGKRKLVGYFENWEATLKALDTLQVFLITNKELKWCQHSVPILKKQHKPKTKNTPNKKSGNTGQSLSSNQFKKKDKKPSTKHAKDDNQLKHPDPQKKAKKSSKSKGHNDGNNRDFEFIM
ncbi:unnamed protein product [Rhizophagus irregularis]|nr:unnamed protein product [Rhizophagus irregularis]